MSHAVKGAMNDDTATSTEVAPATPVSDESRACGEEVLLTSIRLLQRWKGASKKSPCCLQLPENIDPMKKQKKNIFNTGDRGKGGLKIVG